LSANDVAFFDVMSFAILATVGASDGFYLCHFKSPAGVMVVIKKEICGDASQIFRDGLGKNEWAAGWAAEGRGLVHRLFK
jgi:hypothetical protein